MVAPLRGYGLEVGSQTSPDVGDYIRAMGKFVVVTVAIAALVGLYFAIRLPESEEWADNRWVR